MGRDPLGEPMPSPLPALPSPPWSDALVYDVALALEGGLPDLTPVVRRHGVDPVEFATFLTDPVFLRAVLALREEIAEKGVVFRSRARALAEDVLRTTYALTRDGDISPGVRLESAQSIVRWAGLDKPPPAEAEAPGAGGGVTISINIGGDHRKLTMGEGAAP